MTAVESSELKPLDQLIGVGSASSMVRLEIKWPVSGTTQVFHNVPIGTPIEVREFATSITPREGPALQPIVQK